MKFDRDYQEDLHRLVDEIFKRSRDLSLRELAAKANVGLTTVYNLNFYRTRFPYLRTVFRLAQAVGVKIELATKETAKKPRLKLKRA